MTGEPKEVQPPKLIRILFGKHSDYVWRLSPLFIISFFLFISSVVLSFYAGDMIPGDVPEQFELLQQLTENLTLPEIFIFIIFNNLLTGFIQMVLGLFFGLPPLYFLVQNGYLLGRLLYIFGQDFGVVNVLSSIMPHGIIEYPTFFLVSASGMGLGYQLINRLRGKGSLREELGNATKLFIWRIAPLLFMAAIIEVILAALLLYLMG